MKSKIAYILKSYRKKHNFTPEYVVNELQANNIDIAVKTLYGYEAGRNNINADVFLCLCKIYGIQSFDIFFGDAVNFSIEDQQLLEAYHSHPEMQTAVKRILEMNSTEQTIAKDASTLISETGEVFSAATKTKSV